MKVTFFDRILDLIYPPKCTACGAHIPLSGDNRALCSECDEFWCYEKQIRIKEVELPCGENLKIVTLCHYDTRKYSESIGKSVILALKSYPLHYAADFVAEQMYSALDWLGFSGDTVITWVPRSAEGIRKNGFDQVAIVARKLSSLTNMKRYPFLIRVKGDQQKKLSKEDRFKNAKKSYRISERYREKIIDKDILLIDDVSTTGASIGICAELLASAGAKRIFCISFAGTVPRDDIR